MPFKQTQSEKDRESQYLSEQAKQAGSPRNVREGGGQRPENIISTDRYLETVAVLGVGEGLAIQLYSCWEMDGPRPGGQRLAEELTHHFTRLVIRRGV